MRCSLTLHIAALKLFQRTDDWQVKLHTASQTLMTIICPVLQSSRPAFCSFTPRELVELHLFCSSATGLDTICMTRIGTREGWVGLGCNLTCYTRVKPDAGKGRPVLLAIVPSVLSLLSCTPASATPLTSQAVTYMIYEGEICTCWMLKKRQRCQIWWVVLNCISCVELLT